MAKYLNGYDAPLFKVWMPSSSNWLNIQLRLRYQALTEAVNINYVEHQLIDGSYSRKFNYVEYMWTLDYSALAESNEIIKLIQVLNYLQLDRTVLLQPHREQSRFFYIIDDTAEALSLGEHYGGMLSPGNKDLTFKFKTKIPISNPGSSILWFEITNGIQHESIGNVKFLANEQGDYILTQSNELILI